MRYSMKGIFKSPDPFKEKYRQMILRKKEEILHALKMRLEERINIDAELRSSQESDLGDLGDLNLTNSLNISFVDRYTAILKELDNALERVEEEIYGFCDQCGKKIDDRRLEVAPFALYCVACQRKIEEKNRKRLRR